MRCKNILALAIAILLWGTSYSLVKMILEVPPITLALFRVAISLSLLIPLALYKNRGLKSLFSNWKPLLALGITGIVGYQVLQNYGLVMTSASDSGVLLNTDPIFIAIFSSYFLREKISRYKAVGIAIAFAGVSIIVLRGGISLSSNITSIVEIFWHYLQPSVGLYIQSMGRKSLKKLTHTMSLLTRHFLGCLYLPRSQLGSNISYCL